MSAMILVADLAGSHHDLRRISPSRFRWGFQSATRLSLPELSAYASSVPSTFPQDRRMVMSAEVMSSRLCRSP
jgi:hypothetical protein